MMVDSYSFVLTWLINPLKLMCELMDGSVRHLLTLTKQGLVFL